MPAIFMLVVLGQPTKKECILLSHLLHFQTTAVQPRGWLWLALDLAFVWPSVSHSTRLLWLPLGYHSGLTTSAKVLVLLFLTPSTGSSDVRSVFKKMKIFLWLVVLLKIQGVFSVIPTSFLFKPIIKFLGARFGTRVLLAKGVSHLNEYLWLYIELEQHNLSLTKPRGIFCISHAPTAPLHQTLLSDPPEKWGQTMDMWWPWASCPPYLICVSLDISFSFSSPRTVASSWQIHYPSLQLKLQFHVLVLLNTLTVTQSLKHQLFLGSAWG